MNPIEELNWNVEYARKDQIDRLNKHLEEGGAISTFLHNPCEWQLDHLIRDCKRLIPQIEVVDKKKTFLQALFRK